MLAFPKTSGWRTMKQNAASLLPGLDTARTFLAAGRLAEAEALLLRLKATMPPHARLHEYLGIIAQKKDDTKKAARHFRRAVKLDPANPEFRTRLAQTLAETGGGPDGPDEAAKAPVLDAEALNQLGAGAAKRGDWAAAGRHFEAAVAAGPDIFEGWYNLGQVARKLERPRRAVEAFLKAEALRPGHRPTLLHLGDALRDSGKPLEAAEVLLRARSLPASSEERVDLELRLGEAYWRAARPSEALRAADDADKDRPGCPRAAALRARALQEAGRHVEAIDTARSLRARPGLKTQEWFPSFVEPLSLMALGRHEEAAKAFEEANRLYGKVFARRGLSKDVFIAETRTVLDIFARTAPEDWPPAPEPGAGQGIAFINGFPRSGTTLIDAILRTHSKISIAEEAEAARAAMQKAQEIIPEGLRNLAAMDRPAASALRQHYFERLGPELSADPRGRVVIDRHAVGTLRAGLMKRLFPKAAFFLMLRHPCDTVLSAWFCQFEPTHHTANYLTIEDAARYYDLLMTLHSATEDALGFRAHRVRYEDLVADLRGTIEPVLGSLGLGWEEQLARHEKAAMRPSRTSSFAQVSRPLYKSAVHRFEHYKETLEPVMELLTPWIERFGYGAAKTL